MSQTPQGMKSRSSMEGKHTERMVGIWVDLALNGAQNNREAQKSKLAKVAEGTSSLQRVQ